MILRTPEDRFGDLPNFEYTPNYLEVEGMRVHYIDEGSRGSNAILLMHGEPSWSFLYRHMIRILRSAGFRVLAPDLIGFGRSDKLSKQTDHTYGKHVEWMNTWFRKLNLEGVTMFCQDWGSLIGLRIALENQDKFKRIVLSNGGLPTGEQRMSDAFLEWRETSRNIRKFKTKTFMQQGTVTKLTEEVLNAYEAPFPNEMYKAGARIMPSLVPISTEDPEHLANKKAIEKFKEWNIPFLTAFSDSDPITRGGDRFWRENIPGAQGQKHTIIKGAGHFVQEDKGPELAKLLVEFIEDNP